MKDKKTWVRLGVLGLIALLLIVFLRNNWHEIIEGFRVVVGLPPVVFGTALVLTCLTFVLAAMSYRTLAFRRLSFHELFTVELAAAFINRLIPAGIGGLGVHGLYLHKRRHSIAQATAVVSVNNLLGMVVHTTLLLVLVVFSGGALVLYVRWGLLQTVLLVIAALVLLFVFSVRQVRRRMWLFLQNLAKSLRKYERQPHTIVFAALALLGLTLTHLLILHIVANAVGIHLELTKLFIVYSAGVLLGASVPTPGGLAGVETGLVAGFIAYGAPSELAIATTLAFRLANYWFPLVPGSIAFIFARRNGLI